MTDDFTEAARTEAAYRDMDPSKTGENNRAWFVAGAEWAREHLAAQTPQVTIRCEEGKPATCEVRQDGVLIFSGRDHSADLRVAAQEPNDA